MKRALGAPGPAGVTDLDEELEVHIVRLGRRALGLLVAAAGDEVDTLRRTGCGSLSLSIYISIRQYIPSTSSSSPPCFAFPAGYASHSIFAPPAHNAKCSAWPALCFFFREQALHPAFIESENTASPAAWMFSLDTAANFYSNNYMEQKQTGHIPRQG
jgi:hypothetical protein